MLCCIMRNILYLCGGDSAKLSKKFIQTMQQQTPTPQGDNAFMKAAEGLPSKDEAQAPQIDFQKYILDLSAEHPSPDYAIEIDGVGVMPHGGITAVTGQAKQGKTQFLAAVTACLISGKPFGRMSRRQAPGHIVWVDTEQAEFNICATIGRVYDLAGIPQKAPSQEHGLTVMQLRPLSPSQRCEAIAAVVEALKPQVLIIDGIRDLLSDFNDIAESRALIDWLLAMLNNRPGMQILTVLHTNPGGEKMRGHLGTELMNKCQDVFLCTKDNGVFSVKHETRDREVMMPFLFCVDAKGHLSTSTIEQRAGVVDAESAFYASVPPEGAPFMDIVRAYAKKAGITQQKAKDALKQRITASPPTLQKRGELFYRVERAGGQGYEP